MRALVAKHGPRAAKYLVLLAVAGAVVYRLHFFPVHVDVAVPARGDVVEEVLGTGTLEAQTRATVSSKIQARIAGVHAEQNDWVTTGQLLVTLEDADLRQQVSMARAGMEAAQATVERLKAESARAAAILEQAQRTAERQHALLAAGVVSASEVEKADEQVAVAQADARRIAAAIDEGKRHAVAAAESLRYHEAMISETRITSPFAGIIVSRDAEAGDMAIPGAPLLDVASPEVLWVSAWVDESRIDRIAAGQPARVVFRSSGQESYSGTVWRWGRQVDRETRQFLVDVIVEQVPANWALGQRAEVYVTTRQRQDVLAVPTDVLVWRDRRPGVFVVHDRRSDWRPIETGLHGLGRVEVVRGLNEDDVLIVPPSAGGMRLEEGRRVRHEPRDT